MTKKMLAIGAVALGLMGTSCSKDDEGPATATFTLETIGLETLTGGYQYQGWLVVNGESKPTNKFADPDANESFTVIASDLESADEFLLTIEAPSDNDNLPSETRILKGSFSGNTANLSFEDVVTSVQGNTGTFFMGTPTDNDPDNEDSGVWFVDASSGSPEAGLQLNPLKSGWKYEGWVVINGIPVSTGTFTDPAQADDFNPFSGTANPAPPFPGEDFLNNAVAPDGLTFPTDLRGSGVVISIEPVGDTDPSPFFLKPLSGSISSSDGPGEQIDMIANTGAPAGQVRR